jgi:PTS system fructose-specific IIC component
MTDLITPELVRLDADLGTDKEAVIRSLAGVVADAGRTGDTDQLIADAMAREATSATGLPGGIAIPHCRTPAVDEPTLAFARLAPGVEFGAKDGPADLVFLIAAPAGGGSEHLTILAALARRLVRPAFRQTIIDAPDAASVAKYVQGEVGGQ